MNMINSYQYLPQSIKNRDRDGEVRAMMESIDIPLNTVASKTLVATWDVQNASREELEIMAGSVGLTTKRFITDNTLRKYIQSSGQIRELKGKDSLINFLVDTLTQFKVESVRVNEDNRRIIDIRLYRGNPEDFQVQEDTLNFLLEVFRELTVNYAITYLIIVEVTWTDVMSNPKTLNKIKQDFYKSLDNTINRPKATTSVTIETEADVISHHVSLNYSKPFKLSPI